MCQGFRAGVDCLRTDGGAVQVKDYFRDGATRAMKLGNRGPLDLDGSGRLAVDELAHALANLDAAETALAKSFPALREQFFTTSRRRRVTVIADEDLVLTADDRLALHRRWRGQPGVEEAVDTAHLGGAVGPAQVQTRRRSKRNPSGSLPSIQNSKFLE